MADRPNTGDPTDDSEDVITLEQAAAILRVPTTILWRQARTWDHDRRDGVPPDQRKGLPTARVGNQRRVLRTVIDKWLDGERPVDTD